jgi:hypothetical protein
MEPCVCHHFHRGFFIALLALYCSFSFSLSFTPVCSLLFSLRCAAQLHLSKVLRTPAERRPQKVFRAAIEGLSWCPSLHPWSWPRPPPTPWGLVRLHQSKGGLERFKSTPSYFLLGGDLIPSNSPLDYCNRTCPEMGDGKLRRSTSWWKAWDDHGAWHCSAGKGRSIIDGSLHHHHGHGECR